MWIRPRLREHDHFELSRVVLYWLHITGPCIYFERSRVSRDREFERSRVNLLSYIEKKIGTVYRLREIKNFERSKFEPSRVTCTIVCFVVSLIYIFFCTIAQNQIGGHSWKVSFQVGFCFLWQHKKNLADIFDGFTKKQTEDLWAGLNQMCANTLLTLDLTQDDRLEGVCIVVIYLL